MDREWRGKERGERLRGNGKGRGGEEKEGNDEGKG